MAEQYYIANDLVFNTQTHYNTFGGFKEHISPNGITMGKLVNGQFTSVF